MYIYTYLPIYDKTTGHRQAQAGAAGLEVIKEGSPNFNKNTFMEDSNR